MGLQSLFNASIILNLIDNISQPLDKVSEKIENIADAKKVLAETGKKLTAIGGAGLFALTKISDGLHKAYDTQADAEMLLKNSMDNAGVYTEKNIQQLKDYASEMQNLTNHGDEAILPIMASFARAKLPVEQLQEATKQYYNLLDAGQEASSLSRILEDPLEMYGQLKRMGILINKEMLEGLSIEKQRDFILSEIGRKYNGLSEAMRDTDVQFKNRMGDIKEKLGQIFEPLREDFYSVLLKVATGIDNVLAKITKFTDKHPIVAKAIGILVFSFFALMTIMGIVLFLYGSINSAMAAMALNGQLVTKSLGMVSQSMMKNSIFAKIFGQSMGGLAKPGLIGFFTKLKGSVFGVTRSLWSMIPPLLANPITWIVIAVIALLIMWYNIISHLIKNWDTLGKSVILAFRPAIEGVKYFKSLVKDLLKAFGIDWVIDKAVTAFLYLKDKVASFFDDIDMAMFKVRFALAGAFGYIEGTLFKLISKISLVLVNILNSTTGTVFKLITEIVNLFKSIPDLIMGKKTLGDIGKTFVDGMSEHFKTVGEQWKELFAEKKEKSIEQLEIEARLKTNMDKFEKIHEQEKKLKEQEKLKKQGQSDNNSEKENIITKVTNLVKKENNIENITEEKREALTEKITDKQNIVTKNEEYIKEINVEKKSEVDKKETKETRDTKEKLPSNKNEKDTNGIYIDKISIELNISDLEDIKTIKDFQTMLSNAIRTRVKDE